MKLWNLHDGTTKLQRAFKDLKDVNARVGDEWSDPRYYEIQQAYMEPLEAALKRTIEAIQRMADVLDKAERECGSYE